MSIKEELKKPEVAAAVGAVSALVVATAIPAAVLLTAGAVTVGGLFAYHWTFGGGCRGSAGDCPVGKAVYHDGEPGNGVQPDGGQEAK